MRRRGSRSCPTTGCSCCHETPGASALSMQIAALLATAPPTVGRRSLTRKWRQMRQAWALERQWHKDEILEAYLNLASFRGELVGLGAASRGLLHKTADHLNGTEALLLALLLRSPNAAPEALTLRACRLSTRFDLECRHSTRGAQCLAAPTQRATHPPGDRRRRAGGRQCQRRSPRLCGQFRRRLPSALCRWGACRLKPTSCVPLSNTPRPQRVEFFFVGWC